MCSLQLRLIRRFHTIVPHSSRRRPWKKSLNLVDKDHLETSNGGVHAFQWQARLQHLCSHHSGDEIEALLCSPTWRQCQHPAGRLKRVKCRSITGEPAIVFNNWFTAGSRTFKGFYESGIHSRSTITLRQPCSDTPSIPLFIDPADNRDVLMLLEHSVRK